MDACTGTFMYIRGLECTFTDAQAGAALLRINAPDNNITAMEIYRLCDVKKRLSITLHLKASTTFDEHNELTSAVDVPLPGLAGKTFTHDEYDQPLMFIDTPSYANYYWKRLFAKQRREFTPFELRPTRQIIMNIEDVEDDDAPEVLLSIYGIVGLIRDDVDTKPARAC